MLSDANRRQQGKMLGSRAGMMDESGQWTRQLHELEVKCQQEHDARLHLQAQLQQVWAKLDDQGAGLNTLMDLLEDTATRANLQQLADETSRDTEVQLQALADNLNATIQQQSADFDQLCSSMQSEMAHTAENIAQSTDEQLRSLHLEVEAVKQSTTQLAQESTAKLTIDLKGLERSCERRIADVERRVSQAVTSTETWGERVQTQGIITDQVVASISALESKTESAVQLLHKETDHQVRQCRDLVSDQVAALETRFTNATKQLHDSQSAQATAFSADLQTNVESFETKLRRCQTQIDATMLRADGVLHLAETLETRLEDKLGDSSASLEQQLSIATSKLDQAVSQMTERSVAHTQEVESLKDQLKTDRSKVEDTRAAIDDRMEELRKQTGSQMDDKLHEFKTRYNSELSKVQSQVGLDKRELSSAVHKLEESLEQTDRESRDRVVKLRESLAEQMRKDSTANQEKNAAQDAAIADQHAQLDKLSKALGSRMHDRAGVVDARLAEITSIVNANNANATALCARVEVKMSDTSQRLEQSLEGARETLEASVQALESKFADVRQRVDARVSDRMDAFSTKLQETANVFNDRCASIDRRFTQWGQDFSEQNRHALSQCENRVESVSQRLETCESTVTKLVSDCAVTGKTVEATSSHVTKQFAEIDKRIRESYHAQDSATQQARATLESKLAVVSDGLKAMETAQRSLALKGDSTEKSIAESHAQMQQLQQHLEERVREEHEHGQQSLHTLWGELNAQKVAQDKKHHAAEEHWQTMATKLDQQIVDATASVDGKLTDLKASLKATADAIAAQSKEADVHHDRQIKDVERSLAQNGLEDQQRCQQLEQSMMDKDKRMAAELHELQVRFNDRMAENKQMMLDMQHAATAKMADQEREATEWRQTFVQEISAKTKAITVALERAQASTNERHDDLQRELVTSVSTITEDASRSSALLTGRLVELEDQMLTSTERLSDRCQEIEKIAKAERIAIDRKHSTRSTALLERLNATHEIATSAESSATSGHERIGKLDQLCDERFLAASQALATTTGTLREDTDAKFTATEAAIAKLGEDVTENLKRQVDQLQDAVESDLKPLMATVKGMGETLVVVGEQAATADGTRMKLDLLVMDVEEVKTAVKTIDELNAPTGEEFSAIEGEVAAVKEEVQDLGVELSIVASTVDAVQ